MKPCTKWLGLGLLRPGTPSYTCKGCHNRNPIDPAEKAFVLPGGRVNCRNFTPPQEHPDNPATAMLADNLGTTVKQKQVNQSSMTADCWLVQIWGTGEGGCKGCEFKGTKDCGGQAILKAIRQGKFPKTGLPDAREAK